MLVLLVRGVWILFAIRVLGWRSTIGTRTFFTYLSLGALICFTAAGPLQKAVNPYSEASVPLSFALNAGILLLLLLPMWRVLRGRGAQRSLSVADGFLMAFATGLGFDLMGAIPGLMVDVANPPSASAFNLLLPGALTDPGATTNALTMAGHALWAGLVVLVVVSARRFTRSKVVVWAAGIAAFLLCTLDTPAFYKSWPWATQWFAMSFQGALLAFVALAALVAASFWEKLWAKDKQSIAQLASEWLEPLQFLLKRDPQGYAAVERQYRLARRLQLATAEAKRDPRMAKVVAAIENETRSPASASALPFTGINWKTAWRHAWFWQALCWLTLFAVLFFPGQFATLLFNPIFSYQINVINESVIDTLLVAFLLWRFLSAAPRQPQPGFEGELQFAAEKQITRATLWLVTLGWLFAHWNTYYPFPNLFGFFSSPGYYWPPWTTAQFRTFLLLTGACITCVTMRNSRAWTLAPVVDRRVAFVRNSMAALTASTLLYLSLRSGNYLAGLETFHQTWGPSFFNLSVHLGTNGNKLVGWTFALINGLYWVPFAIVMGLLTRVAVNFFSDQHPGAGKKAGWFSLRRAMAGTGAVMPGLAIAAGLHTLLQFVFPHSVFAGGCTTANDCICIPPGADEGLGPVGPLVPFVNYLWISGDDGDGLGGDGIPAEAGGDGPPDIDGLTNDIYDLKKQFEDLEDQLGKEVAKQLGAISDYAQNYNKAWFNAMKALDSYLDDKRVLNPAISELAQKFKDMSDAMNTAGILDEAAQAALALGGMVEGGFAAADAELEAAAAKKATQAAADRPPFLPPKTDLPIDVQEPGTPGTRPPGLPPLPGSEEPLTPPTKPIAPAAETPAAPPAPPPADPPATPPATPPPSAPGEAPVPPATPPLPPPPKPVPTLPDNPAINPAPTPPEAPLGPGMKLTFYGDAGFDEDSLQLAQKVKPIDGVTDVHIHGSPDSVGIRLADTAPGVQNWQSLDAKQLLQNMKDAGYQQGDPIRLLACSTGDPNTIGNFAQQLANESGAMVTAPTDTLWLHDQGVMTIGPTADVNTGRWKLFTPLGKTP